MTTTQKAAAGAAALGAAAILLTSSGGPEQQPLVQANDLHYVGTFTLPQNDGTGRQPGDGWLTYGGTALGLGPDGQSIYFGCHAWGSSLARVSIPAIGGAASIVEPCAPVAKLADINPGDGNKKVLGGSLAWGGRVVVSAYSYYDGNGTAVASHFAGPNLSGLTGPPSRVGSTNPGLVGGYMGVVPQEWRALLGGPALTGQCCIAIIGRSSHGPSVSVFNPDDIGAVSPVPATMLVGYPTGHELGAWGTYNPLFTGATQIGGIAFPAGTRSVLFIGRHGGTFCYGTGTGNKSLEGQPDRQGNLYCYDPVDNSKGTHGFPYHHQVWAYDANDLLAVKQGTKQPWDVKPYAVWTLSDIITNGGATLRSATYDPATHRIYLTTDMGDARPVIHVYDVGNASPPPPPPVDQDCEGTWSAWTRVPGSESACSNGQRTYQETRDFTVTTPQSGNGKACPASPETQIGAEACQMPPAPIRCVVTGVSAPYANGDIKRTIRCDSKSPAALPRGFALPTIP